MIDVVRGLLLTSTGKDTLIVSIGSLVNIILAGLFFILATRILGPHDFGLFSTIVATGVVALRLTSLGVESGILRFAHKKSKKLNSILSIAYKSYLLLGAAVAFVGFFVSPLLANFLGFPNTIMLLRIAFASILLFHLTNLFIAGLQAQQSFLKASLLVPSNNIVRIVMLLFGAYFFSIELYSLTIIYFLSTIASTLLGKYLLSFNIVKFDQGLAKSFFKYNLWVGAAIAISSIPFENYFLLKISGATSAGLYAAPFKILTFAYEFGGSFTRVLASRLASFDTRDKVIEFSKKAFLFISLFIIGLTIVFFAAKPIALMLFGQEYSDSIQIMQILSISFMFFFATLIPSSIILYHFGESKIMFFITLLRVSLFIAALSILVPSYQAIGAAAAFLLVEIFAFITMTIYVLIKLKIK